MEDENEGVCLCQCEQSERDVSNRSGKHFWICVGFHAWRGKDKVLAKLMHYVLREKEEARASLQAKVIVSIPLHEEEIICEDDVDSDAILDGL